jgi:predicted lipoprotein with Yx(FWY)xxD motif
MKMLALLLVALLPAAAGCGDDETPTAGGGQTQTASTQEQDAAETATTDDAESRRPGTRIVLRGSEFGEMLFDSRRQAIYVFERDRKDRTVCYGECAEAWPPVLTEGEAAAGKGVDASLLGTIERRDGTLQVTYAGRPLYYYAHEAPGEVRCHNVNLNGGLWWVVGPDGKRRA